MKNKQNEGVRSIVVAGWLAFVAVISVMIMTHTRGMGITTDSVVYFQAARHVMMGQGVQAFSPAALLEPLTQHPPLYPFLLSLGGFFAFDILSWSRIMGALLFGLNVFLITMMSFRMSGHRRDAALSGVLALVSVHLAEIHTFALSEPLFLSLSLLSLWSMMKFIEDDGRKELYLAAILAGVAVLTRYGGVATIATGALILLTHSKEKSLKTVADLLVFLLVASMLPALWMFRNMMLTGGVFAYNIGFFPSACSTLVQGVDTFSQFLLPSRIPMGVRWVVLAGFVIGVYLLVQRFFQRTAEQPNCARARISWLVLSVFVAVYVIGSAVTALTISNGGMPLDRRILLPVLPAVIILLPSLLRKGGVLVLGRKALGGRFLILIMFLLISFLRTVQLGKSMWQDGYGYAFRPLQDSELVKVVKTLDDRVPVYADDPYAFYFYAGRPAYQIPQDVRALTYLPAEPVVIEHFQKDRAVAIVFHKEFYEPASEWSTLSHMIPLSVFMDDSQGGIYGYKR